MVLQVKRPVMAYGRSAGSYMPLQVTEPCICTHTYELCTHASGLAHTAYIHACSMLTPCEHLRQFSLIVDL